MVPSNHTNLISRWKQGEQHAFRDIVYEYQDMVLNTCLGFLPRLPEAEDVCQEVFVEVYRSLDKFRGDSKLSTWIYKIAVRKSLEAIRYKKREKRQAYFGAILGLGTKEVREATDNSYHPGVVLENKERAKVLFQHIEKLPERQKTALILQKIEGLTVEEIAPIMELKRNAVDALLFRARKNLQSSLEDYYRQMDEL